MRTDAKGMIKIDKDPNVSPIIVHEPLTPKDRERGAAAVEAAVGMGSALPSQGRVEHAQDWSAVYDGRGTCRMGTDPRTSVVDPMLRVHGLRGLRVVDGSVLPSSTPYLAMPEVLMLAERAADLILDVPTYAASDLEPDQTLLESAASASAAQLALCAALGVGAVLLFRRQAQSSTEVADF